MQYLLYAVILGFSCWLVSDALELVQGRRGPVVYYLTAAYHFLAGIGLWGLYRAQGTERNLFNLVSTALASVTYLGLTLFPLRVMASGVEVADYMAVHPLYRALGAAWFVGIMLFSTSILRTGHFPRWSGVAMLTGFAIFSVGGPLGWPMVLLNINSIVLSAVVIHLGALGLQRHRNGA